jgi:hypothetical protein
VDLSVKTQSRELVLLELILGVFVFLELILQSAITFKQNEILVFEASENTSIISIITIMTI